MDTTLLSYEGLKVVLQYMEANVRFQISLLCPSIRTTEKIVPLKIDQLKFEHLKFRVNKTEYRIKIYQKYHRNKASKWIEDQNKYRGIEWDLDKFGFGDLDVYNLVTPGDILIHDRAERERPQDDASQIPLEELLSKYEGIRDRDISNWNYDCELGWNGLTLVDKDKEPRTNAYIEEEIDRVSIWLIPYHCRRDNTRPPWDNFIQLTIDPREGKERIYRFEYNMKLYEALKRLSSAFFGDRRQPLKVRRLWISEDHIVLRLPLGMKMKVQEMEIDFDVGKIYEALSLIVDESSYPLDVLIFNWWQEIHFRKETGAKHKIITAAILADTFFNTPPFSYYHNIPNRMVHMRKDNDQFKPEHRFLLIQNWIETGREIGTIHSYAIKRKTIGHQILELMKERLSNVTILGESCVTISMNQFSKLQVSYEKSTKFSAELWTLNMEVTPAGSDELPQ